MGVAGAGMSRATLNFKNFLVVNGPIGPLLEVYL